MKEREQERVRKRVRESLRVNFHCDAIGKKKM